MSGDLSFTNGPQAVVSRVAEHPREHNMQTSVLERLPAQHEDLIVMPRCLPALACVRTCPLLCRPTFVHPQPPAVSAQHDMQLDYYGKQLASAGSDRRIKVFSIGVDGSHHRQTAELVGHDGPVWQLAWAHPEFGNILASCSYDRQVWRPLALWLACPRRPPFGRRRASATQTSN